MEAIIIAKYVFLVLAIAFSLFYMLTCLFGWAHYYGWSLLITKTESKLTGPMLQKFLNMHAFLAFLCAATFFLCFFDNLSSLYGKAFFYLLILIIYTKVYFKQIANQSNKEN